MLNNPFPISYETTFEKNGLVLNIPKVSVVPASFPDGIYRIDLAESKFIQIVCINCDFDISHINKIVSHGYKLFEKRELKVLEEENILIPKKAISYIFEMED